MFDQKVLAALQSIGRHGAEAVMEAIQLAGTGPSKARILTICNTGSLATAGYGTALGVIRALAGPRLPRPRLLLRDKALQPRYNSFGGPVTQSAPVSGRHHSASEEGRLG